MISATNPPTDFCAACGAAIKHGRIGCQALFDELMAQATSDYRYASVYALALDAYCMQHVEEYGLSAKSYAAHLMRLCCGVEHDGDPVLYVAIQRWLSSNPAIEKPALLSARGRITVVNVRAARTIEAHQQQVRDWARDVWDAYATQHGLAHRWIELALDRQRLRQK